MFASESEMSILQKIQEKIVAHKSPLLLSFLVLFLFTAMEMGHGYFFFQDDNRHLFLPFLVHNLRSLAGGEIPLFNFHQSLGTPTSIQYASFYPVHYLGLGLSNLLFGHYFATMEVVALLHLEVAAVGFFFLMRSFRVGDISCVIGALAWAFCGFVITVGNSWGPVLGYAAYLPWIMLFSMKQIYGCSRKNFIILVLLRVADFLVGNPQFFVYTVTFDFLAVTTLYFSEARFAAVPAVGEGIGSSAPSPVRAGKFFPCYFSNYLVVILLAMPLILQAFHHTMISADRKNVLSWSEYSAISYKLSHWVNGIFAPFHDMPMNTWSEQQFISHMGYLPVIGFIVAILAVKRTVNARYIVIFAGLALFSFLWATDIWVAKAFYHLPVYNRLRYPFKLAFFTSFFLVMVSTFGLDLIFHKIREKGSRIATIAVIAAILFHVANFIFLYAVLPQHMFSRFLDKAPFEEGLKTTMTDGRIVTGWLDVAFDGNKNVPTYTLPTLGYNFATLWGLYFFGGYDALIPEKNLQASLERGNRGDFNVAPGHILNFAKEVPLDYFRKWGVKWYVFEKSIPLTDTMDLIKTSYSDGKRNILYDPAAKPMVYWADDGDAGKISFNMRTNSIEMVTQNDRDGKVIIGVLYNPFFTAFVDGEKRLVTETEDMQIALDIPKGRHTIVVRYCDKFMLFGSMISLATLLVFTASIVTQRIRKRKLDF